MEAKFKSLGNFASVVKSEGGALTATASTPAIDRDGERMLPSSFVGRLDSFRANPVILASHVRRDPAGQPTIIGSATRIEVEKDALVFDMKFATTPLAKSWQSLYDEGHAKAFSVGFIGHDGKMIDGVFTWTDVELVEISACAVPSNREALKRGYDAKEVDDIIARVEARAEERRIEDALRRLTITTRG